MAKHIIFLVHGMGDTVPGWSKPVQALIRQKYNLYRVANRQKFDKNFSFKEINYNHVFENHIEKWQENASAVTSILEASGIDSDLLNTLMGFSTKTARKEFASTHVLDVILYRFMKGIKSQVIAHISEQLVGKLNESSTVPPYSIICHSLGTAVMHDVMQANLTTDHFPLSTAHGLPRVYMTVANVSRVLEDSDTHVYSSAVRPQLADRSRIYACSQFINVAHTLDPFTKVRTFKPGWEKGATAALNNLRYDSYEPISISGLTGFNPHDFEHYLRSPETHVALFRNLLTRRSISDTELAIREEEHRQLTLGGQFDPVEAAVKNIQLDDQSSLNNAVLAWSKFQQVVKSFIPK
jgi:hypothetical protein